MTLIELLVSLGVLSVICIAFATIMAQTHRVVNSSNALMQANATAAAVAQTLRDDLASLSTQGFVAVYTDTNGDSHLIFTAVAPFKGRTATTSNVRANAARIDYGWTDNTTPNDPNDDLLWRRAILMTGTVGISPDPNGDQKLEDDVDPNMWLGAYQEINPSAIPWDRYYQDPNIPTEVKTPADADLLWPMLARPCLAFRVSWWDKPNSRWDTNSHTWTPPDFASPATPPPPPAIRVNFSIKTGPKEQDKLDYEVICPLRL
ncbi:MAG: hypothetical protein MUP47_02715 [Phycisphaerae bacterium]|nr:hypothetical protein [Phycisphaerae bacterium]